MAQERPIRLERRGGRGLSSGRSSILILVFGLMLGGIGAGNIVLNRLYVTEGRQVVATVTDAGVGAGPRFRNWVEYSFTLSDGRQFEGRDSGYPATAGGTILVEYLEANPARNRVVGSGERSKPFLVPLIVAGGLFVLGGAAMLRRAPG